MLFQDLFESKPEPALSSSPSLSASASTQRNVSPVPGPSNRDFSIHEIFDGNEMNDFELKEGLEEVGRRFLVGVDFSRNSNFELNATLSFD